MISHNLCSSNVLSAVAQWERHGDEASQARTYSLLVEFIHMNQAMDIYRVIGSLLSALVSHAKQLTNIYF